MRVYEWGEEKHAWAKKPKLLITEPGSHMHNPDLESLISDTPPRKRVHHSCVLFLRSKVQKRHT